MTNSVGFIKDIYLSSFQSRAVEMLAILKDFLDEHDLLYMLNGGTLIGAIRHRGMIPWDDDIDLSMLRADYNKLISLKDSLPYPLQLAYWGNDPQHVYPFIRIYDITTSVSFDFVKPITRGVWIDIFPVDGTFTNHLPRYYHIKLLAFLRMLLTNLMGAYARKPLPRRLKCKYFLFGILSRLLGKKFLIWAQHRLATLKNPLYAEISAIVVSMAGEKSSQPTGHYIKRIEVEFAGLCCFAPAAYDGILKKMYGDYMIPPTHNQRGPTHQLMHVDLHKSYLSNL